MHFHHPLYRNAFSRWHSLSVYPGSCTLSAQCLYLIKSFYIISICKTINFVNWIFRCSPCDVSLALFQHFPSSMPPHLSWPRGFSAIFLSHATPRVAYLALFSSYAQPSSKLLNYRYRRIYCRYRHRLLPALQAKWWSFFYILILIKIFKLSGNRHSPHILLLSCPRIPLPSRHHWTNW